MTNEQITTYKKNMIDNLELEFVCKNGRSPSIATLKKWGKEANEKIAQMKKDIEKWQRLLKYETS